MCHFRRIVMHYRKNHNSITGPTWKYPRYFKYFCTSFGPCVFLHTCVTPGSLSLWTMCWGRTCATTTSTGRPTSKSAHRATSTSPLLVSQFLCLRHTALPPFMLFRPLWDSVLGPPPTGKQDWHCSMGRQDSEWHDLYSILPPLCTITIITIPFWYYQHNQRFSSL